MCGAETTRRSESDRESSPESDDAYSTADSSMGATYENMPLVDMGGGGSGHGRETPQNDSSSSNQVAVVSTHLVIDDVIDFCALLFSHWFPFWQIIIWRLMCFLFNYGRIGSSKTK